jgi:hypothetical protein
MRFDPCVPDGWTLFGELAMGSDSGVILCEQDRVVAGEGKFATWFAKIDCPGVGFAFSGNYFEWGDGWRFETRIDALYDAISDLRERAGK